MARFDPDRRELADQLLTLGVPPGGILIVHTAFSKVAPVEGGPRGLIEALRSSLGPEGTLVMPNSIRPVCAASATRRGRASRAYDRGRPPPRRLACAPPFLQN
jgi:aminoglycoside N3'-acetyltransferase